MTCSILDVAVSAENGPGSLEATHSGKIRKYQGVAASYRNAGYEVAVRGFVLGNLGSWSESNEASLTLLGVSPRYARLMRQLMVSETVRYGREMYIEHVRRQGGGGVL